MQKKQSVIFRCDASSEIGFGHLVRCLALADALHHNDNVEITFAMREDSLGADSIREHGYESACLSLKDKLRDVELREKIEALSASILIVDVPNDLPLAHLQALRATARDNYCLFVLIDDVSERRFAVDLAFYPPVPQVLNADWKDFSGEKFIGWEWTILRAQFDGERQSGRLQNKLPQLKLTDRATLLITMGGSDPAGMTLQAVRGVDMVGANFSTVIVVGSGFRHTSELRRLLSGARRKFVVRENVTDMRSEMARSDVALCAYGMTAFELAASGIPAIYLCLTEDHAQSASALESAGLGCSLGLFKNVSERQIANAVSGLFADQEKRHQMSRIARQLIDGKGANRIAEVILKRANKRVGF